MARHFRGMMPRLAALIAMALLAGCNTAGDMALSPTAASSDSPVSQTVRTAVAVAYPRFDDHDPHNWTSTAPWQLRGARHRRLEIPDLDRLDTTPRPPAFPSPSSRQPRAATASTTISTRTGSRAKAAGVPRGAYHFYYFCRTAEDQARWFIRHVPRDRSSLPPVLDMEWNPQSPSCKLQARRRHGAQRDEDLPDDGRAPLRQEADHLHLGRFLRRQRPLDVPRLSLLAALGRRPPRATDMAAIPSPSGNIPAPARCPA